MTYFLFLFIVSPFLFVPILSLSSLVVMTSLSLFPFLLLLLLITLSILFYQVFYMSGDSSSLLTLFIPLLLLFVFSMATLVVSGGWFTLFLGWDLLGLSSYFLVLHYLTTDSSSGSMATMMSNRVGDLFLFFLISLAFYSLFTVPTFLILILLLTAITKSAQFPFSAWLTKAMAAPTPISALVHSSTLVTAGLFLLIKLPYSGSTPLSSLFHLAIFTLILAGLLALVESDLKKVVALSTLSQLGLMGLSLSLALPLLTLLHLMSHALFKSCLFLQVGYLIHLKGTQDVRLSVDGGSIPLVVSLFLLMTFLSLAALFFTSGSVSKETLLSSSNLLSLSFSLLLFNMALLLTLFYTYRFMSALFKVSSSFTPTGGINLTVLLSSLPLFIFALIFSFFFLANFTSLPASSLPSCTLSLTLPLFIILVSLFYSISALPSSPLYKSFYLTEYLMMSKALLFNLKFFDSLLLSKDLFLMTSSSIVSSFSSLFKSMSWFLVILLVLIVI